MELEVHYYNRDILSVLGIEEDYWLEMSYFARVSHRHDCHYQCGDQKKNFKIFFIFFPCMLYVVE